MPKTEKNTRPYNRSEKRASKRIRKVMPNASKTLGKASWSGVGKGREHNSPGVASQALREVAQMTEQERLKYSKKK